MNIVFRAALVTVGLASLVLGIVGIVLPILPTTPFLLLSAACFLRGSRRLYTWLMNHRHLGSFIRNYRDRRALTARSKVTALLLLWLTISYSACVVVEHIALRVSLFVIALAVTIHIATLGTMRAGEEPR